MSFASDLSRISRKTNTKLEDVVKNVAISLFNEVITRTPVDTGRLRGNWQATLNTAANGTTTETDSTGTKAQAGVRAKAATFNLGDSLFLVNNLPYAKAIEFGHSSVKAPAGMVRVSMARIKSVVAKEARRQNRR